MCYNSCKERRNKKSKSTKYVPISKYFVNVTFSDYCYGSHIKGSIYFTTFEIETCCDIRLSVKGKFENFKLTLDRKVEYSDPCMTNAKKNSKICKPKCASCCLK